MQAVSKARAGLLGLVSVFLISCAPGAQFGATSFQAQYGTARTALEAGRYDRAISGYTRLLSEAGPLEPRLRLELAHSYLRAGKFAQAAQEARRVASSQSGAAQGAALSVQATADHELGLAALAAGDSAKGGAFLRQADTAMKQVVTTYPDLDPLGALAARRASIAVRLRAL